MIDIFLRNSLDNLTCVSECGHVADAGAAGGERSSARRATVHVVTAEEASSGAFSIQDVVLPLPGSQIQYPEYQDAEEEGPGQGPPGAHQVGLAHKL